MVVRSSRATCCRFESRSSCWVIRRSCLRSAGRLLHASTPRRELEDIHRQAEENAIMRMADEVRRGRYLWSRGDYDEVVIRRKGSVALAAEHDTVLCGRNVTRRAWNHDLRRHHGFVQSQGYRDPQRTNCWSV